MKKCFLFVAMAATILSAGCSQDEQVIEPAEQGAAIEFRGVVDKATKATSTASADFKSFFVQAYLSNAMETTPGAGFMSAAVYYEDASWKYAPKKYFPTGGTTVEFYAYAPIKDVNMTTALGVTSTENANIAAFGYTVPVDQMTNTGKYAVDLLVASTATGSKATEGGTITLPFKHALSAVTFEAKNIQALSTGLTYVVHEIRITGRDKTGTYTYGTNGNYGKWSANAGTDDNYIAGLPVAGVALEPGGSEASYEALLSYNDMLMVLPQNANLGNVAVTFSLLDGAGEYIYNDKTVNLSLANEFEFEMNTKYNFQFTFGKTGGNGDGDLTAVSLTATFTDWANVEEVDLPWVASEPEK